MSVTPKKLRQEAARGWLFALLATAALCVCAGIVFGLAAESPAKKDDPGRYLIIVESSSSMSRYATNTLKVVGNLMLSGLSGQLRPGDTIGVWTFNEKLNAGGFPLQVWTPQTRQRIATGVLEFLQRQPCEKQSLLSTVVAPMTRVVKDSDKITVLLITDGNDKVSGTPFDQQINETYRLNFAEQRRLRIPFVTVLRARKGEFIGCKIWVAPWPLEFPAFPAEPKITETPDAKETSGPQLAVTSTPPAVVRSPGKQAEPTASSPTNAVPAEPPKPPPVTEQTTAPGQVQPVEVAKPEPIPVAVKASETNAVAKNAATPVTPPPPPAETPPASITATTQQQVAVVRSTPQPEVHPPPKTESAASPTQTNVVAPAGPKTQSPSAAHPQPVDSPRTQPVPSPDPPPVVQTAVAAPSETVFNRSGLLIAAIVLLFVALGLVYVFMRRSRAAPKISLITRSMDRDKK